MDRLKYFGILLVLALLLAACTRAELPAAPSLTTPLIEYSIDQGKTWHSLTEDEVKRLDATAVQIRQTEVGAAFRIKVQADTAPPSFRGSITRMENIITVEGKGGVVISAGVISAGDGNYARIILE